jgi:hypothetical protein
MFLTLQVVTLILVSVAMSLALPHALELPGKMRLCLGFLTTRLNFTKCS